MKTPEQASESGEGRNSRYLLQLYVAGNSRRCVSARKNLQRICEENVAGSYDLEIINILENPEAAERADIVAVPTLVKQSPPPTRKVVGDLSRTERVLEGLDIDRN